MARCWPASGLGSGPSEATLFRAVFLVTSQFTPDPDSVGPLVNIDPEPPSMANALCNCAASAPMSPPASDEKNASNGFSGSPPPFPDEPLGVLPDPPEPPRRYGSGLSSGCGLSSSGSSAGSEVRSSAMLTPDGVACL